MFAVIQLKNQQFKVTEGETISANRLDAKIGEKINFDQVLLVSDGKTVKIGQPNVKGAKVSGEVIAHPRAPKVVAFKYRKRKDSARTHGHRQDLTQIKIAKISI